MFRLLLEPLIDHILLRSEDIGQEQFISIPVHIERLINRNFHARLVVSPQIHQNLVLDAPGRVRGKLDLFFRIERVNCLDEADGSNRNQILHTNSCIIKFLCNVDDETQVVFDQLAPCRLVFRIGKPRNRIGLLLSFQRRRENICAPDIKNFPCLTKYSRHGPRQHTKPESVWQCSLQHTSFLLSFHEIWMQNYFIAPGR